MPRVKLSQTDYAKKDLTMEIKKSAYALYGSVTGYSKSSVMSQATISRRLTDPDEFTLGELRQLRKDLRIDKDEFIKRISAML